MGLAFPIEMSFRILTLAPQVEVRDANNQEILFVRQKFLKLKEDVRVFADSTQSHELYSIHADRMIDWSAKYSITADDGRHVGRVERHGTRSLFKAYYEICDENGPEFKVREKSIVTRMLDSAVSEIPGVNFLTGYLFNPTYLIEGISSHMGQTVMQMIKRPSFFGRKFSIELLDPTLANDQQERLVLGLLMIVLLERFRG